MRHILVVVALASGCPQEPGARARPSPAPSPEATATTTVAPSASAAGPTPAECEARIAASLKTVADPRDALVADKDCCVILAKKHDVDAGASWDGDHRTYCCTLLGWAGARACTP